MKNIDNVLPVLKEHNGLNRGVFFVVQSGGQTDEEITGVTSQFMEIDNLSFSDQMAKIDGFPVSPSVIVKTAKSLHCYWLIKDGNQVAWASSGGTPRPAIDIYRHIQRTLC